MAVRKFRGGATRSNSEWKTSGGSGGRKTSKNFAATSAHAHVAPLKGSTGGKATGRKLRG